MLMKEDEKRLCPKIIPSWLNRTIFTQQLSKLVQIAYLQSKIRQYVPDLEFVPDTKHWYITEQKTVPDLTIMKTVLYNIPDNWQL